MTDDILELATAFSIGLPKVAIILAALAAALIATGYLIHAGWNLA